MCIISLFLLESTVSAASESRGFRLHEKCCSVDDFEAIPILRNDSSHNASFANCASSLCNRLDRLCAAGKHFLWWKIFFNVVRYLVRWWRFVPLFDLRGRICRFQCFDIPPEGFRISVSETQTWLLEEFDKTTRMAVAGVKLTTAVSLCTALGSSMLKITNERQYCGLLRRSKHVLPQGFFFFLLELISLKNCSCTLHCLFVEVPLTLWNIYSIDSHLWWTI